LTTLGIPGIKETAKTVPVIADGRRRTANAEAAMVARKAFREAVRSP
jgi:hypothetical protein